MRFRVLLAMVVLIFVFACVVLSCAPDDNYWLLVPGNLKFLFLFVRCGLVILRLVRFMRFCGVRVMVILFLFLFNAGFNSLFYSIYGVCDFCTDGPYSTFYLRSPPVCKLV
jgi:hypothetical protein